VTHTQTCPDWCVTDHDKYPGFHGSEPIVAMAPHFHKYRVRVLQYSHSSARHVQIMGSAMITVEPQDALGIADIIEDLAGGATPAQLRELAAVIRKTAALTGEL
jgi:hypothetical protein